MGSYIPSTAAERQEMLEAIGCKSIDELYAQVPAEMKVERLDIPEGKSELEVRRILEGIGSKNPVVPSVFRGGGSLPALYSIHCEECHVQGDLSHRLHPLSGGDIPGRPPVHL